MKWAMVGLAAGLLVLAAGTSARAELPPAAASAPLTPAQLANFKQFFEEGQQAASAHQWHKAREKFAAAYAIKQSWLMAGMLGTAEVRTQRFRDAAEHLAIALSKTGTDGPRDDERRELQEDFDRARVRVGALRISVDPPWARVLVNGAEVKPPIPGVVFVEPGSVTIEAQVGTVVDSQTVTAIVGREGAVVLAVVKPEPPRGFISFPGTMTNKPLPTTSHKRLAGIVVGSVGLAGLLAGIATGGVAIKDHSTADDGCGEKRHQCAEDAYNTGRQGERLTYVSTAMFVVGGLGVAIGAPLFFSSDRGRGQVTVGVMPSANGGSLSVKTSF